MRLSSEELQYRKLKSKLKQANSELEMQKIALDQTSIVATTNSEGIITYVNDKFCEISEFSREELIGHTHRMVNSGHHTREFFKNLWSTIREGNIWKGKIKNRSKTGQYYWVATTIIPFLDRNGEPYQYFSIRNDITDRIASQQAIEDERARRMYSEKMASLGVLSSGVAHELGNPLAALRGRLEMLEYQVSAGVVNPDKILNTVQKALKMSDRMSQIIKGLRSYARDGSKDPFLLTSVNDLIFEIIEISKHSCMKNNILLNVTGLNKDIKIECRETELGQTLVNLISNACDAVKNQSLRNVDIHVEDLGSKINISITDSGPGIPLHIKNKIFDPFFTTKAVGQGTGLGLSITHSIIKNHKGKLYIDPNSDKTRFVIELPKKQVVSNDSKVL